MNEDKRKQMDFQMGEVVSIINTVVPVYKDTSQPDSNDLIKLRLPPRVLKEILFLFFYCKRFFDLNKDLPELLEQKVFMEPILKPSITYKELNDFLNKSFNMKDLSSKDSFNMKDFKSVDKMFSKLTADSSITDRIFCLIKEKRGTDHIHVHWKKDLETWEALKEYKKHPDKEYYKNLLEQMLTTNVVLASLASLNWKKFGSFVNPMVKELKTDSFHKTVNGINNFFKMWSQQFYGLCFIPGVKVGPSLTIAPDPRSLGKLKLENLEFVKLQLDPSDTDKIFKIMSNLDLSSKNISRFDFERMTYGLEQSTLNCILDNQEIKPSFKEILTVPFFANTRCVDLAFKILGPKEGQTILLRGVDHCVSHLYERGGELLKTKSKNVLYSTAKSDLEINNNIKKSAFTDRIRIVTDDRMGVPRFSSLGLPMSVAQTPVNLNNQLNKDRDHKVIKSFVKHNKKVLYQRSDHADTQYYTGADIVLHAFPDKPLKEYKKNDEALKYPKFVTEDMLGIPSIATSNKKIKLPKSNPTFANILASIKQLDPQKGLLGLLVDEKFLSNSLNSGIRKILVEHDLIEMVVSINRSWISDKTYWIYKKYGHEDSLAKQNRALGLTNLNYEDRGTLRKTWFNPKKVALVVINLNKPKERKCKILFSDFILRPNYGEYDFWDMASAIFRKAYKQFSFEKITEDLSKLDNKYSQEGDISKINYIRGNKVHLDNVKFLNFDLKPLGYLELEGSQKGWTSFDYYQKMVSQTTHTLGSICEIVKGVNLPSKNKINITGENIAKGLVPVVQVENLHIQDNKQEMVTELSTELGDVPIGHYDFCDASKLNSDKEKKGLIDEKCILIKLTGHVLNSLIFDPEKDFFSIKNQRYTPEEYKSFTDLKKSYSNKIFINQNIAAIKIKKEFKDKILFDYLYYDLLMIHVNIVKKLKSAYTRPRITIKDLESIPIKLDSIDIQREQAKRGRLELLQAKEAGKIKYEQALETREIKDKAEFELSSFINHEGGRKIARINTKLKAFLDFLEKNDLENKPLQDPMPGQKIQTIGNAIADALNSSEQLRKLLAKISDLCKEEIRPEDLALEDIEEVFRKSILTLDDDGIFSFKFACKASNKKIYLEKNYFIDAMENLINNAKTHGFDQDSKKKYIIEFKISDEGKGIIIDYKNNGRELPEEIDEDIFCQIGKKGKSSPGQGIGGARIKKMLDGHLASFKIIRENSVGVHFRFSFPNEINPNQN